MSMTFSSDGRLFAAGGDDHMVTVWDTVTREELVSLPGHTDNVTHVVFSKDNRHLATASDDGTLRKWELHAMLRPTPRTEVRISTPQSSLMHIQILLQAAEMET